MGGLADTIGGGFQVNSVQDQSQWARDTLARDYPQLMQALMAQDLPYEQARLNTAQQITPGYNNLAVGELNRLAPQISQAQGALDAGQAANDIANLNQYGQAAGQSLRATDASANPEFYSNLALAGGKFSDALNALSPNLSAGQRAEVERGTARLNPQGSDNSAVSTAEKAMQFGTAHQNQVNNFAAAVNSLSSNLGSLRSGLTPINTALGRDSRTSPALAAITPVTKSSGGNEQLGGAAWQNLFGASINNENLRAGKFKTYGDKLGQDATTYKDFAQGNEANANAATSFMKLGR